MFEFLAFTLLLTKDGDPMLNSLQRGGFLADDHFLLIFTPLK